MTQPTEEQVYQQIEKSWKENHPNNSDMLSGFFPWGAGFKCAVLGQPVESVGDRPIAIDGWTAGDRWLKLSQIAE